MSTAREIERDQNKDDMRSENHPLYLDYQATTPCDPRVVSAMEPFWSAEFGNPHSRNHAYGWGAEEASEKARAQVAASIGAEAKDIVFTSGATEANNLAIQGLARFWKMKKPHIITTQIEHKCILDPCRYLEQDGFRVTYLPVSKKGLIDLEELRAAITDETLCVSVIAVNNEIGVIQPLAEIGAICREKGVYFHTDAAQALGKIPLDVEAMNIDLMSLSSHKVYGPKGIGALYVRRKPRRVRLAALIRGGGQERGMRSGTLPTPLCVGFGLACEIAAAEREREGGRMEALSKRFLGHIHAHLDHVYINGDPDVRVPWNVNLSFAFVEGEGLMMAVKDLAVSSGSACTSASLEPSYVLKAIGVGDDLAHTSLRLSFGRMTTEADVDYAARRIVEAVQRLRAMSPLYEMAQKGIDINAINWVMH